MNITINGEEVTCQIPPRAIRVARADVVDGVQPPDVSTAIEPHLQSIKDALPYGYRIETGGSTEEGPISGRRGNGGRTRGRYGTDLDCC